MYPPSARSTTTATNNNLGGNQIRSSSNQGTMPSPPIQQGLNKGLKSSSNPDPLRQLNLNQQQSSRPFSLQQSTSAQPDGQDHSYGNQRRARQQQDYNNDFSNNNNNRRGNQKYGYDEWPRTNNSGWDNGYRQQQSQRYSRQQQNYEGNRFYPSRRMFI
jgi:hypothetical protein